MRVSRGGTDPLVLGLPAVQFRESAEGQGCSAVDVAGSSGSSDHRHCFDPVRPALRVGYVSSADLTDRRAWSGTHVRIVESLRPHVGSITPIGPFKSAWRNPLTVVGKLSRAVLGRTYAPECSSWIAADVGRQIDRCLISAPCDVILAPAASGEISTLKTRIPIVYLSDATFALMRSYYPKFARMLPSSQRAGHAIDQRAIDRASRMIYPSSWAARSAIDHYHADPKRVLEIPFGANFDTAPPACNRVAPPAGRCRMLFVGKGWDRKGGPMALAALRILRTRGIDATLVVVGCPAPAGIEHEPGVEFISSIDKRDPAGERRLQSLYCNADVFVLPTRAECFGVVFCEAASYGLPIVAASTGGVPSAVSHNANGVLLPLEADPSAYADAIASIVGTPARYEAMAAESRRLFETRLNWAAFGSSCAEVLHAVAAEGQRMH